MFFGIPRVNQAVNWLIGRAGQEQDAYPMRINDVQGRTVSGFVLRKNSDGTERLDHVITTTNFITRRSELVPELDAPTLAVLEGKVEAEKLAYQATLAADAAV